MTIFGDHVDYVILFVLAQLQRRGTNCRYWVHPLNQRRRKQGAFHHLVAELRLDRERHHMFFRMSAEQMDELLSIIGPELHWQSNY